MRGVVSIDRYGDQQFIFVPTSLAERAWISAKQGLARVEGMSASLRLLRELVKAQSERSC